VLEEEAEKERLAIYEPGTLKFSEGGEEGYDKDFV
jgi:hypothetical protein